MNKADKIAGVGHKSLTLHPWQVQAVYWLIHMERSHLHAGLLADNIGLGKTISALAYIVLTPWTEQPSVTP